MKKTSLLLLLFLSACSPHSTVEKPFAVLPKSSAHTIGQSLQREGLIAYPRLFVLWVKLHPKVILRPGIYPLSYDWSGYHIFQKMRQGPPRIRVTFPEGWTAKQMASHSEALGITPAVPFLQLVEQKKMEGFLFPDTYFFDQQTTPEKVIETMYKRFNEVKPSDFTTQAKHVGLSERQLVILASMVEKEAQAPDERPVIAGVFLNRLRKHWRLESCATVQYAMGSTKARLTYKDLEIESPYNTYRHAGLPPGPIGNPGKASLEAAAHPSQTDMMFFVAQGNGTHRFSKYYKEHLAAQKRKH